MSTAQRCIALVAAVWLGSLCTMVEMRRIEECDNLAEGFNQYDKVGCSYTWVFCDGEDSYLCDASACSMDYECDSATSTSATVMPITTTTATTNNPTTTDTTTNTPTPDTTTDTTTPMPIVPTTPAPPSSTTVAPTTTLPAASSTPTVRETCTAGVYDYYPYPGNCHYYYQCYNGYLYMQQCALGAQYVSARRRCEFLKIYDESLCQ